MTIQKFVIIIISKSKVFWIEKIPDFERGSLKRGEGNFLFVCGVRRGKPSYPSAKGSGQRKPSRGEPSPERGKTSQSFNKFIKPRGLMIKRKLMRF